MRARRYAFLRTGVRLGLCVCIPCINHMYMREIVLDVSKTGFLNMSGIIELKIRNCPRKLLWQPESL